MRIKISIIIPTYNRAAKLKRCLGSILSQKYSNKHYEVIVVNDSSKDGTNLVVSDFIKIHRNITLMTNHTNKGPAYCRNRGIKKAKGVIIAFTDDDCVISKNWLRDIVASHRQNHEELAIGGPILSLNPLSPINKFRDFQKLYALKKNSLKNCHFSYIPTCNVSCKRDVFKKIGYFDENFRHSEDIELNMRLLEIGKPVYMDKKIIVFHDYSDSIKDFIKKSYYAGFFIPIVKKKHPKIELIVPLDTYSTLIFLLAPFVSIALKIFSVDNFTDRIKLLFLIILDEMVYRIGLINGLSLMHKDK